MRQLLAELTSEELTEWRAYYELEPFGDAVADQRHGIAVAAAANMQRDSRRRREPYVPEDFIPWHPVHRNLQKDGVLLDDPEEQSRLIKRRLFNS